MKNYKSLLFFCCAALSFNFSGAYSQNAHPLPLTQNGGTWASGHVQGIAIDLKGGHIYYSFTNLLAKYDFDGKLIGTLRGWTGHLGDLDFNPENGKVYGSLEYKKDNAFYIAVIDVSKINQINLDAKSTDILRTIYLPEVAKDYAYGLTEANKAAFDNPASMGHKYGSSGIDGVSFGPKIGATNGKNYLTVAYGIYSNLERKDNDHQVLLQYDINDWDKFSSPLDEKAPHHNGPSDIDGKYFVRTGNTTYGVQNLAYDAASERWFMGVYKGKKPEFPNYLLYAFDAKTQPIMSDLIGVPISDNKIGNNKWEQGLTLKLSDDGLKDSGGIRGWNQKADVGFQPIGNGLFYVAVNSGTKEQQTADITLMRWVGDAEKPLVPVVK